MERGGAFSSTRPRDVASKKSNESISVLVVNNDASRLATVAAIFEEFNYEVVTVRLAGDALNMLRIKEGAFDLVVSDTDMPDMNGFELLQAIGKEFKNLPVVSMSSDPRGCVALKALENGAVHFILKPVCADDVKDLWQFATRKTKSHVAIQDEETIPVPVSSNSSLMNGDWDPKKK